jgi:protein phosphatase
VRLVTGAATDTGLVRESNEDAFVVDPPLYAVADGMGGHSAGEVAASVALETLERGVGKWGPAKLSDAVAEANRVVFERQVKDPALMGMGTTLTAVVAIGERLRVAHVGDSRAYLWRDGNLRLLTDDHTWVNEMVRAGEITEAEARTHPNRSMLTRALGLDPDVAVDETSEVLRAGDRILLCSDGLTALLPDEEIEHLLETTGDPQTAAERLVNAANAAGGVDNTTVIVLDVVGSGDDNRGNAAREVRTSEGPAQTNDAKRTRARPFNWRSPPIVIAGVTLLLLVIALPVYARAHWFVGVHEGRVAIFRGINAEFLGIRLYGVEEVTPLIALEVTGEAGLFATGLDEGIPVENREAAQSLIRRLEDAVAATPPPAPAGGTGTPEPTTTPAAPPEPSP